MNKKVLSHLVWSVVGITAFVLGTKFSGPSQETNSSPSDAPSTRVSNRGDSSSVSLFPAETRSIRNSNRITKSEDNSLLSESELLELGRAYRTAKSPIARRLAFSEILKNLTAENARLLREQIAHLPPSSPEYRDFHYAWGAIAGQEVVEFGIDTPGDDMGPAIAGWASADPQAAIAWLKSLDMEGNPAYRELLDRPNLTVDGLTGHFARALVHGLSDSDPDTATDFVLQRFENGDHSAHHMMRVIAGAQFRTGDYTRATNWIESIPESGLKNTTMHRVAGEIANQSPQRALDWIQNTPESESRSHGIGATLHTWAGKNPTEAANYISTITNTEDRDAATYGYATRVVHDDPAMGVEWAANISDPGARDSALVDTGRTYFRRDPEGAREWLSTTDLSPEVAEKIVGGK